MQDDHTQLVLVTDILRRMEAKVDKALDDHERRIRSVERRQWINWGAVATSGAALGVVVRRAITGGH